MNKQRRIKLKEARLFLEKALMITSSAKDEEQDCVYNMPESLQDSERCNTMEDSIDSLEEAMEYIEQAVEKINSVC